MGNNGTQAAQAFNGANGATAPVAAAAIAAFIKANGLGNTSLQLTPNALANGVLFGGGKLWAAMQPNKAGSISARGLILWACVNGVPQHTVNGVKQFNVAGISTKLPKQLAPVPMAAIQAAHQHWGASVYANAATPAGGTTNQIAVAAVLNGGFGLSGQTVATYGTAYGKLVATS